MPSESASPGVTETPPVLGYHRPDQSRHGLVFGKIFLGGFVGAVFGVVLAFLAFARAFNDGGLVLGLIVSSPIGMADFFLAVLFTPVLWAAIAALAVSARRYPKAKVLFQIITISHYASVPVVLLFSSYRSEMWGVRNGSADSMGLLLYIAGQLVVWGVALKWR